MKIALDHVGVLGTDIHRMVQRYRNLGFYVTDPHLLNPGINTGAAEQYSAHIMFETTYIELTAVHGADASHHLGAYVGLDEGIRILILATDNAWATHAAMSKTDFDPGPIGVASRQLSYGARGQVRFQWFSLSKPPVEGVLVGWVEHLSRREVFDHAVQQHPNGARDITALDWVGPPLPNALLSDDGVVIRCDTAAAKRATSRHPSPITALDLSTRSSQRGDNAPVRSLSKMNGKTSDEAMGVALHFISDV